MKNIFVMLGITTLGIFSAPAHAQTFLFHLEGNAGDRKAFFADKLVTDRTPPSADFGPIEIKQLDVTIVYENEQQPELANLRLQFECISKFNANPKKPFKAAGWNAPVKMRIAEGSSILRRIDLKNEDASAGPWETTTEPVMLKAHKLACNEPEIDQAIRSSVVGEVFKGALFKEKIAALGLVDGVIVYPTIVGSGYIDLVWGTLWPDGKHPDPSGKWSRQSTPQEKAEAERKMAIAKQQLAELTAKTKSAYEPKVEAAQIGFAFDKAAAKLRGGRKLRYYESVMLKVWQAKTEDEVAAKMGRPSITNVGEVRFLSYGQQFDNRVVVTTSSGASWEEGLYTACDVQFVTIPDGNGVHRVADIRLSIDSSNITATNSSVACSRLLETPGK
jgi:hypothetical protein